MHYNIIMHFFTVMHYFTSKRPYKRPTVIPINSAIYPVSPASACPYFAFIWKKQFLDLGKMVKMSQNAHNVYISS